MNDSAEPRLTSIDPGGAGAEADRWRMVNANNDLITQLLADLQRRVRVLEVEIAKLRPSETVGDNNPSTD